MLSGTALHVFCVNVYSSGKGQEINDRGVLQHTTMSFNISQLNVFHQCLAVIFVVHRYY